MLPFLLENCLLNFFLDMCLSKFGRNEVTYQRGDLVVGKLWGFAPTAGVLEARRGDSYILRWLDHRGTVNTLKSLSKCNVNPISYEISFGCKTFSAISNLLYRI